MVTLRDLWTRFKVTVSLKANISKTVRVTDKVSIEH